MKSLRVNVLLLALLAAMLIMGLAQSEGVDAAAMMPLAAALIGSIGATMLRLTEPEPNPLVAADALHTVLSGGRLGEPQGYPWRVNVLLLALLGVSVVATLAVMGWATASVNVAGIMVGGITSVMAKLVDPEEPSIPASVVSDVLKARSAETDQHKGK